MMTFLNSIWNKFLDILGLRHNSKYVKNYLNEANMKSGIFMSAVIVILEVWLVIRQSNKYVIPYIQTGNDTFQMIFTYLWTYFLLMSLGTAMLVYCTQYVNNHRSLAKTIITIVFATISLILCGFMPFEFHFNIIKFTTDLYTIKGVFKIIFYGSIVLFNLTVIFASIYRHFGGKNQSLSSVLVISLFALVCLMFGVMISFGDFISTAKFSDGSFEHKQIICFLMMSIYVGCLLIWKPLISVSVLGTLFLGFYFALKSVVLYGGRQLPEGDEVNYLTFFISLTMICISIYSQRVSEAKKDAELELLATKDPLTDLYSFGYFTSLVNRKIKEENLKAEEWIFLFLDITSFKIFNDQRGFEEGNAFLKSVGKILTDTFTRGLVSRQADDHFVIFGYNEDIEMKLEMVNEATEKLDLDIRPGIKVGGYIFKDSNEDAHLGIEKARYACAELKNGHHGNFLTYDKEMHNSYRLVQYVVRHIDEAVEKKYIKAYYQPVVYSKGRTLCGVEALARWDDPRVGFLSPALFVPALENAQLIYKLDIAMLEIVCEDLSYNLIHHIPAIPVSINFSRLDFVVMDIVGKIDEIITKHSIPRNLIHIEITESALMNDGEVLMNAIKELHRLGYTVWLDDFGSGYSSFNVLKDYEFDVLKLDMAFLVGFSSNYKAKTLIKSVVAMAEQIGMKTLAEGVETKEEASFLESIGCGRLQGYLYGKPLSYDDLKAKIDSHFYSLSDDIIR